MNPPLNHLTLVLPLCRPKPGWASLVLDNARALRLLLPQVEMNFIVVNDGFETPELLSLFALLNESYSYLKIISYAENKGKGFALRTGVHAATSPYLITTDADFPYENKNIVQAYHCLLNGADIVAGKRSQEYYSAVPLSRRLISRACIMLNKIFLKLPICDAQSGLKGFNAKGRRLFLQTRINRFLVDTEFLALAHNDKFDINVVDLKLKPGVQFSPMGYGVLYTEFKNLLQIIRHNSNTYVANNRAYYVTSESLSDV